jgi:uncharacterized protein YejL (UPF0352 family)
VPLVAANGMAYAKGNVREGLLGRMLTELLDTRIMIKQVSILLAVFGQSLNNR